MGQEKGKGNGIEKCCGHIPTLWGCEERRWMYVCQECGARQYEGATE